MRRQRLSEEDEAALDLTPMLDIVFIMLIFFIVTATFVRDPGVEVNKPEAQTAVRKQNIAILIAVTSNNTVHIDNQEIDLRAVRAIVERMRAENPRGPVVIQVDARAKTGIVMEVADQARLAGAPEVTLATKDD
jgi:biopolymer transport protein ExbD